jgi:hypothetical protein
MITPNVRSGLGRGRSIQSAGVLQSADPYTVLLLPCTGADESTTFTDIALGGNAPHSVSAVGGAQVDTANTTPFGDNEGYLLLNGSGQYLQTPDSADFDFTDFTAEAWVYPTNIASANYQTIMGRTDGAAYLWSFTSGRISGGGDAYTKYDAYVPGLSLTLNHSAALADNVWQHCALTREGDTWRLWLDGTKVDEDTASGTVAGSVGMLFGRLSSDGSADFTGRLCEIRLSSIARYTANFTPPATRFSPYL